MRILYVGGFDLPDGNAAAQRVIANAKIFESLGYQVRLYGCSRQNASLSAFEYEQLLCFNRPYPESSKDWLRHLMSISVYTPIIEEWKPNLIIAYNYPAIALWKLLRYAKKRGIKVVADCTEWYQACGSLFFRLLKNIDTSLRMRFVQPRLDGIIAISSYLEHFYKARNMEVLTLPPLVDKCNNKWQTAQMQKCNQDHGVRLFYAGTPMYKDRIDVVITALIRIVRSQSIKVELNIVGITEEQFYATYPYFDSLPTFVRFHGKMSHQYVLNMLVNQDYQIFIRDETRMNMAGFPTKYVESISSGTLVLANYTSDLNEYLKSGITGYPLDISSQEALENTLLHALQVPASTIQAMRASLDTSQFDFHNYIDATKIFLERILGAL